MMIKGIDISHWNRVTDFNKVKESGIDFAIIKAGGSDGGFYTDRCFDNYHRLARLAGLKVGAYYFAGKNFYGFEAGRKDAERFVRILGDRPFEYPVFIDIEMTGISTQNQKDATDAAIGFCEYMEDHGYFTGIYSSDISGWKERLEMERLDAYCKWVARYGKKPNYVKEYGIWQKSSTGQVPGIVGNVDMDVSYIDYAKIITSKHFNNC